MTEDTLEKKLVRVVFEYSDGTRDVLDDNADEWLEHINNIIVFHSLRLGDDIFPNFNWHKNIR